ncbi:MAG: DUF4838 domain-containing protein [Clostridia bacterium]|nr:DUF4838 domain-containing protein [Clostridia bacterium]
MSLILTREGSPESSIVLPGTAGDLLRYAAKELQVHIEKATGAELPIVNTRPQGASVILGTPESLPELLSRFPDDVAWLSATWDQGKRYGSDGFAVRSEGNAVWIFGACERGAINGVYDFLEKNLGFYWFRTDEELGLVFDRTPTAVVSHGDYREKSPFEVRGWHMCCNNWDYRSEHMIMRNKLNAMSAPIPPASVTEEENPDKYAVRLGMKRQAVSHNLHNLVTRSPIYDPECREYWNTDEQGIFKTEDHSNQVNIFSQKTIETIAATLIRQIQDTGDNVVFIGMQDSCLPGRNYPWDTQPFEYEPGKFVYPGSKDFVRVDYACDYRLSPDDEDFVSTVWFTFINKIARIVRKSCPDAEIQTFGYFFTENPPLCPLDDNVHLVIAPIIEEDLSAHFYETDNPHSAILLREFEAWSKLTPNIVFYDYYGCFKTSHVFDRAIWSKLQSDLQFYAKCNFTGLIPEGVADCKAHNSWAPDDPNGGSSIWDLNALTFWIYGKLTWNPDEDIPSLVHTFCDKYFGGASEPMQRYYSLLWKGWELGRKESVRIGYHLSELSYFMDTFIGKWGFQDEMLSALRKAWELADETEKKRIRRIKEVFESYFAPDSGNSVQKGSSLKT